MAECRKFPRMRVLKSAKIVLGTSSVLDCGARVKISNAANLPEEVAITFDAGRTCRPCRVAWRRIDETGLQFTDPPNQAAA